MLTQIEQVTEEIILLIFFPKEFISVGDDTFFLMRKLIYTPQLLLSNKINQKLFNIKKNRIKKKKVTV